MTQTPLQQVAALCWRHRKSSLDVLLITSRETKRWIIPKGWPMEGRKDYTAAKREAFEEAGVDGRISKEALGQFSYEKIGMTGNRRVVVTIYALEVEKSLKAWPEMKERERQWFSLADAALRVAEPGLKAILRTFRV